MYPVPSEERSIPNKFGRCTQRVERPLPSSNYHSHYPIYQRDADAATFHKHPTHVLWDHFSVPDGNWQYYGSRKHVLPSLSEQKESKKRCRIGGEDGSVAFAPSSSANLQTLLPTNGKGLAAPRPEVEKLADRFSESPFKLNVGELHRGSPFEFKIFNDPSRVPLDPSLRSTVNPLTMQGAEALSPPKPSGKRMLLSPMSDSPTQLSRSPSSMEHQHTSSVIGPLEGTPLGFSGSDVASTSPKLGKKMIYGQPTYDPLGLKRSHGEKYPELASPQQRQHFFEMQQDHDRQRVQGMMRKN